VKKHLQERDLLGDRDAAAVFEWVCELRRAREVVDDLLDSCGRFCDEAETVLDMLARLLGTCIARALDDAGAGRAPSPGHFANVQRYVRLLSDHHYRVIKAMDRSANDNRRHAQKLRVEEREPLKHALRAALRELHGRKPGLNVSQALRDVQLKTDPKSCYRGVARDPARTIAQEVGFVLAPRGAPRKEN
jgi:hypothetical protein